MADVRIFPKKESDLDNYFNTAIPYITESSTAARLGISQAQVDALLQARTDWAAIYPRARDLNLPCTHKYGIIFLLLGHEKSIHARLYQLLW